MTRFWRFLCSLRLGVWCGLALTVLLLVASLQLIYQSGLDDLGGPPLLEWLNNTQHLSGVWWIWLLSGGAGLFLINIICCTIESLRQTIPGILRPPKTDFPPSSKNFYSALSTTEVARQTERLSRSWGFRTILRVSDAGITVAADKGRWWLISPQIAHVGLIMLLCGLLVSATSGFKLRQIMLQTNNWQLIPEAGLSLRLLGNDIEIKQNSKSKTYSIPKLNQPIFHNGLCIYYTGEDQQIKSIELEIKTNSERKLIRLESGQEHELEPGVKLVCGEIIPDFRIGSGSDVDSASAYYRNPAVHISLIDHNRLAESKWFFVNYPNFSRLRYQAFDITLNNVKWSPSLYIDIVRNPGAGLALIGGLFLVLGLTWNLLGGFKQVYILITKAEQKGSLLAFRGSTETITRLRKKFQLSQNPN